MKFGLIKLISPKTIDNVVNIQSFGNGLYDIDDHNIDHPIIAIVSKSPTFLQCTRIKYYEKIIAIDFPLQFC